MIIGFLCKGNSEGKGLLGKHSHTPYVLATQLILEYPGDQSWSWDKEPGFLLLLCGIKVQMSVVLTAFEQSIRIGYRLFY